ncbi:MAG: SUMF1/EgtB/PvdO family nonheme iron enzyme [Anaerolineae bacterium]|nr:SUMF1/EgtB/PvdO family nonheme iron enzyme [Anaerolineae bacterium]
MSTFDRESWKTRVAEWWQEAARDLPGAFKRWGVRSAYGLLTASAWLPLLEAYGQDPGAAVATAAAVVSGVGTNLLSNLVQGTYDRASAPRRAEQEVQENEALRAEHRQIVEALDVIAAAQAALGERWEAFYQQLCTEDRQLGGALRIETGGGAYFAGSVDNRGILVGRDQVIQGDWIEGDKVMGSKWQVVLGDQYIGMSLDQVAPETLLEAYLRWLADDCRRLPLGVVDPRFVRAGSESPVPLDRVYVDLDVLSPPKEEAPEGERVLWGRLMRGEGGERTPLLEAISHPKLTRFVLLGDPGSGKTTFVNYLAYILASSGEIAQADAFHDLLPIRLVLRDVAAHCIPSGATRGQASMLWAALRADLVARLDDDAAAALWPWLQKRLLRQGGVFLLDGLDEVPESDQRRRCLLQAVAELSAQLPGRSRVMVTARPYAYTDPQWRLEGFVTLILAPFDDGQVRRFVECWYQAVRPAMGWDETTARGRGERLLSGLEERPYLADLAVRPLLLTLMATLHTSWGQLPEDRAELYEETVKLLLSRWQRARETMDEAGQPVIEPGIARALQVEESVVRAALHRLAYDVHARQRADAGRTESDAGPADIGIGEVLAAFAPLLPDGFDSRQLLGYLETRAGLLIGRAPGVYAFPHRSFQEYLAACFLAEGIDFARALRDLVCADYDWWRQVFLLGVGKARQGGLGNAVSVVNTLLPEGPDEVEERQEINWQAAILAGEALLDLRFPDAARGKADLEAVLKRVRRWLAALLETPDALAPRPRAGAGDLLARLGDPRRGIYTLPLVLSERGDGVRVPDVIWCEVPEGPFLMGSDDQDADQDEKPPRTLALPGFYIARYPITYAQFRPFVEAGGYDRAAYWTPEGWAWREGAEADLSVIDDANLRESYVTWLARRPKERRDRPYWWDDPRLGLANRPVVGVSWYEAMAYCCWLEEQSNVAGCQLQVWRDGQLSTCNFQRLTISLPSEAQWEKAARGTDGRKWPWGNEWAEGKANTQEAGIGQTSAVGCFPGGVSPYGCLDMAGNVWEWTRSKWGKSSIRRPDYGYPYDPADGRESLDGTDLRVVRGGAWNNTSRLARCAFRDRYFGGSWYDNMGFRVSVSLAGSVF